MNVGCAMTYLQYTGEIYMAIIFCNIFIVEKYNRIYNFIFFTFNDISW